MSIAAKKINRREQSQQRSQHYGQGNADLDPERYDIDDGFTGKRGYSALAVEGNVVLAVGTDDDVMAHAGPDTVVTDLRGRTMLPGFVDGHSHFCMGRASLFATQARLSSSPPVGKVKRNIAEIRDLLKEKAASTPKGEWILGHGGTMRTALADRRHPLASDMDDVTPDHPVLLCAMFPAICAPADGRGLALVRL